MTTRTSRPRRMLVSALAAVSVFAGMGYAAPAAHAESIRAQQWYLDSWNIEEVWKVSQGAGISVAVVDSGVDATHPDLAGQIAGAPLGDGDALSHGTKMASAIVGTGKAGGGQGTYGVAPQAKVISMRVKGVTAEGLFNAFDVADAIKAAADSDARIINLSLARTTVVQAEQDAVAYAISKGKLVVAGGGNAEKNGTGTVYPAAYPGVLGVAAVDRNGTAWSGGNQGNWISLAAPGVDIPGACTEASKYCMGTGSSDATAITSGVAALLWSQHPDWTANQVIKRLIDNTSTAPGEQVPNDSVGYGIVSPRRALQSTAPPGPADVNPLVGVRGVQPSARPSTPATKAPSASTGSPGETTAPAPQNTAAAPASPPADSASGSDSSGPGTVFAVVGAVVGGILLLLVLAYFYMRSQRTVAQGPPPPPAAPPIHPPQPPPGRGY
ncbi:S8 family serine peptidase [Yinghuangia soli]|uniref:S8 family serine peptidase n=1 Tax=Yinghuangia soli TaxID=2908204 RepID=A0AA41U437_9ACTN|nr:S8 family serine peptidase [Yinghuangia soli]MCF2528674.1 S8 family serine peptidase [Yinghuangia soli]